MLPHRATVKGEIPQVTQSNRGACRRVLAIDCCVQNVRLW